MVIYLEPMEDSAKGKIYVYMCVFFGEKKRKKMGIKTSKVDRPVSKHLRNQRRLNLHTLFTCF
jgi:hypothetical protein